MAKPGLAGGLLDWYRAHRRDLPWRAKPGEAADPYAVWLSEIMLQQTTVAAVKDYYRAFLATWPNVQALAAAPLDDVLKAWAGLGYYARARNLHACARTVAGELGGRFPDTEAGLQELPGIGPYTAAAIAAIAFDRKAAAVDGNVERVISRLDAIETPLPGAKPAIRARTLELVPDQAPGDFAQALMDLGATVCTPRSPDCPACPWSMSCAARKRGDQEAFPKKAARKAVPARRGVVFWIERGDGAVLLRRRPNKGLLGGMMEVPSTPWEAKLPAGPEIHSPLSCHWSKTDLTIEHTFTHFHLSLEIWRGTSADAKPPDQCRWVPPARLHGEALPTVMRKVVDAVTRQTRR